MLHIYRMMGNKKLRILNELNKPGLCALSHLGDTDPRNPESHGPLIVTAQVLDVLRLLLDLRMLETHEHTHALYKHCVYYFSQ